MSSFFETKKGAGAGVASKASAMSFVNSRALSANGDHFESVSTAFPKRRSTSVLVLYTGGTIGMVADKKTGALKPSVAFLRHELDNISKLEGSEFPQIDVAEFDEVIDSSDVDVDYWAQIADCIEENYFEYDGFVVIMGTDTMAYTASALSFMLQNLAKPVVFTGSMIPLFKGQSDARRNLLISVEIAARTNIPEVCIFFHDRLLRGNRAKKVHTSGIDAFKSPNFQPLATYGTSLNINDSLIRPHPRYKLQVLKDLDPSVMVIRLIPGFANSSLEYLLRAKDLKLKALILELFGVGNLPIKRKNLLDILKEAIEKKGLLVAVCSQCVYGEVNLAAYEVGKALHDIGAVATGDMTIEAVTTKLAFLFGQGHDSRKVKALLLKSIRGEVSSSYNVSPTMRYYDSNFNHVRV